MLIKVFATLLKSDFAETNKDMMQESLDVLIPTIVEKITNTVILIIK